MSFYEFTVVVLVGAISAGLCAAGLAELKRVSSPKKAVTDQKCPHCDKWQSEHGGWAWVGNTENPEIDFAAECGGCGLFSYWVWVGPGICATYEEVKKPKLAPTNFHDTSFINGGYVPRAQCPPLRNPITPPGGE